jgi:hypothetical protein
MVPNYLLPARHDSLLVKIIGFPYIIVVTRISERSLILFCKHIGINILFVVLYLLAGLKISALPVSCGILASLCLMLIKTLELLLLNMTLYLLWNGIVGVGNLV